VQEVTTLHGASGAQAKLAGSGDESKRRRGFGQRDCYLVACHAYPRKGGDYYCFNQKQLNEQILPALEINKQKW
jgi:hypothetical protein